MPAYIKHKADGTLEHIHCDGPDHSTYHTYEDERDAYGDRRARDEREEDDEEGQDEELAQHIGRAVMDALRTHRKAKDGRRARDESGRNTTQNDRGGEYDTSPRTPQPSATQGLGETPALSGLPRSSSGVDHRRDFDSVRSRARDSALGRDSAEALRSVDRKELLGIN